MLRIEESNEIFPEVFAPVNRNQYLLKTKEFSTLITVICTIFCAKNISFVKYFLWPDFTLSRGLAKRTPVYECRGRVFKAHSNHRE